VAASLAQETKIGFVNTLEVLYATEEGKRDLEQLNQFAAQKQQEIGTQSSELQKLRDQYLTQHATFQYGGPKTSPVHATIGPDFHIVANRYASRLRNFHLRLAVKDIAKAIGPNDGTTVQNHPITQENAFIKGDIGMQHTSPADDAVIPHMNPGKEGDLFFDHHLIPHKDKRMNGDILGNARTLADMGQRRDPMCCRRPRVKQSQEASEGDLRSFDLKQRLLVGHNAG